jgi:hypothetical protein
MVQFFPLLLQRSATTRGASRIKISTTMRTVALIAFLLACVSVQLLLPALGYNSYYTYLPSSSSSSSSNRKFNKIGRPLTIDRIYYINLETNPQRQAFMEEWLGKQAIPYQRISAHTGGGEVELYKNKCVSEITEPLQCQGIAGLTATLLDILEHYNTTGVSLVLHDDFVIEDMNKVLGTMENLVPANWDVVRFDCYGNLPSYFPQTETSSWFYPTVVEDDDDDEDNEDEEKESCPYNGGSHAMLWRDSSIHKLKTIFSQRHRPLDDIGCRLASSAAKHARLQSWCVNPGDKTGKFHHPPGELSNIPSHAAFRRTTLPNQHYNHVIDRIYYINLDKNTHRRAMMEKWLSSSSTNKQSIPYERIPAVIGSSNVCGNTTTTNPAKCRGVSGLAQSTLKIIDTKNTTGLTLVLDDDFVIKDMDFLEESIQLVPPDWDVIRWDCWGLRPSTFTVVNEFVFQTGNGECDDNKNHEPSQQACHINSEQYFGGTFVMLWRDSGIPKLRKVFGEIPYHDIDARLSNTRKLNSYCINFYGRRNTVLKESFIGYFAEPKDELTDIQV